MSRVAVVTGSNKGIGFEIVKGLCKDFDGIVYLTSRDDNRGLTALEKLKQLGYNPSYHRLDITDAASVNAFCEHLRDKNLKVDILVNNAGVLFRKDSKEPLLYQADQTILVNYKSLVNFTEKMLPLVRNGGRIINISSSSGHLSRIPSENVRKRISDPSLVIEDLDKIVDGYLKSIEDETTAEDGWGEPPCTPYVVSKVAVNAYTFILQRKCDSKDIKVNCVHPGYVASDMTAGVGDVTPEQGAVVPLYLALRCGDEVRGAFFWSNCTQVPWDGADPRGYIDNRL